MSKKVSTIKLGYFERIPRDDEIVNVKPPYSTVPTWRVLSVTDSLDHNPGDHLDRKTVDGLCHSKDWKVTIVKDS